MNKTVCATEYYSKPHCPRATTASGASVLSPNLYQALSPMGMHNKVVKSTLVWLLSSYMILPAILSVSGGVLPSKQHGKTLGRELQHLVRKEAMPCQL